MKKLTPKSSMIMFFPAIIMIILTVLADLMIKNDGGSQWEGFYNVCLLVIFPLIFAVQGIFSCLSKVKLMPAVLVSLAVYAVLALIFLGPGALLYLLFYLVAALVGYMMFFLMGKLK
ncbi:hypothetical protein [Bacillus testis]|uniref:hypothetical protein n=1 Tax=Bacillus testis TaxID=1622072 RepID=UPI00067E7AB0|nr:hypothetical protein [Bacillus testis]